MGRAELLNQGPTTVGVANYLYMGLRLKFMSEQKTIKIRRRANKNKPTRYLPMPEDQYKALLKWRKERREAQMAEMALKKQADEEIITENLLKKLGYEIE